MTSPLADGAEIAGFRVESLLGRGGMASVYLARDLQLGRRVALKVLSPELAASPQFQRRFHRESRLLASMDHPNIVPVYQAGEVGGLLYIAMRYVDGSDLDELLDQDGKLDPPASLRVLTQVAAALEAAHEMGLVHRDVKPGNVLVSAPSKNAAGRVYLTDFGLIKQLSSVSNLTSMGNVMGTMLYLSPEQVSGKPVDARTDIYALGGLAFRCLTGLPPFDYADHAALLWAHLSEAAPAASECSPGLPEAVDDVIWTAMAKQPEERYASAAEFATALTEALATVPAVPAAPAPPARVTAPPRPTGPTHAAGTVVSLQPLTQPSQPSPPTSVAAGGVVAPRGSVAVGGAAAPPPPPQQPGRSRTLAVVGAVLLAALVVAGTVVFAMRGDGSPKLTRQFQANDVIPFEVAVPETWHAETSGNKTVFAPQAAQLLPLFVNGGSKASWSTLWPQVQRDPSAAVGLYTFSLTTPYDPATQTEASLGPQLPAQATFSGQYTQRPLDGTSTVVREGDLTNDGGQRLHFLCYVAERPLGQFRREQLLFLAPPQVFDGNRVLFDSIAKTVRFH